MKESAMALFVVVTLTGLAMRLVSACTSSEKQDARTALTALSVVCGENETIRQCSDRILNVIPIRDAGGQ